MDVNRNNQETEGPKDVVKKENNPLDLSLTKKEDQEHNLEEEDENDSIEVNDDEVKNEVKNEVSLTIQSAPCLCTRVQNIRFAIQPFFNF